jgi:hypothetical protein
VTEKAKRRAFHASVAVLTAALAAAASAPAPARADDREMCASSSERGQRLRKAGHLIEAHEEFAVCSRAGCPNVVKRDCDRWIGEVETSLPTVVVAARDAQGRDLVDVRVFVDEVLVTSHLDGKAIPVNPGPHTLRYELADGRPVTGDVVIHEGEKARVLPVRFGATVLPPSPLAASAPPPATAPAGTDNGAKWPVGSYVLGGIGVASLAVFAALAITGQSTFDQCAQSHACSQSQKDSLSLERAVAWSMFGVGVVALGAATWVVISRPVAGGAAVALHASF